MVDTNVTVHLFLSGDHVKECEELLKKENQWVVPLVWRSEFRSVLMKYLKVKRLTALTAVEIAQTAEKFFLDKEYPVSTSRVIELSLESGCSTYDCEFVALAENLGVKFITVDKKIIHCFPKIAVSL